MVIPVYFLINFTFPDNNGSNNSLREMLDKTDNFMVILDDFPLHLFV